MSDPTQSNLFEASHAQQSAGSTPVDIQPTTTHGRPRREGNESLWKRARRTLGTSSLTFLQPQSRPVLSPKSDDASTSATGGTAPSKRREQVRHAQRTHRQRTQNYIKTLESEVIRLRGSETKLMMERDKLQGQVEILRSTILLSNIPLPPGVDIPPVPSVPRHQQPIYPEMAHISYHTDNASHQRLHLNWTSSQSPIDPHLAAHPPHRPSPSGLPEQTYRHSPNTGTGSSFPEEFSLQQLDFKYSPHLHASTPEASSIPAESQVMVDNTVGTLEMAIEFVLALEHPCMAHLPHPSATPSSDPSNHVLMASTPLIFSAPQQPQLNTAWNWTTNMSILKELLNLSKTINLDGEITPVEAWHRIRQHPDFWRMNRQSINGLKNELSLAVQCYGFGAILDEQIFRTAFARHLAASQ